MFGSLSIFAVSMLAHEVCAVSILDFGATCSEATNTVAIQRAIDDRAAVGGVGRRLRQNLLRPAAKIV